MKRPDTTAKNGSPGPGAYQAKLNAIINQQTGFTFGHEP